VKVKRLRVGEEAIARIAVQKLKDETPMEVRVRLDTDYLREFLSCERNYFLVALIGEQPVGLILAYRLMRVDRNQDMMWFYEVVVDEKNRNRGVGTLLINALKKICRDEKIMKMWVLTNSSNLAAVGLYKGTGGIEDASGDELSFTYLPDYE
jgi:ribosomal protein S18 acetylase RimI-like enzyme